MSDNLETILGIIKCSEIIKSVEFEEHWENINCKKEPEEGSLANEALGAENSDAMEPDSTTSVSELSDGRIDLFTRVFRCDKLIG